MIRSDEAFTSTVRRMGAEETTTSPTLTVRFRPRRFSPTIVTCVAMYGATVGCIFEMRGSGTSTLTAPARASAPSKRASSDAQRTATAYGESPSASASIAPKIGTAVAFSSPGSNRTSTPSAEPSDLSAVGADPAAAAAPSVASVEETLSF